MGNVILLKEAVGEVFTAKEVAEVLKSNVSTVRKHYKQFGGFRIGTAYRFTAKGVQHGMEKWQEQKEPMG